MMKTFLAIVIIMNIVAFMLMKIDKKRARQHERRISERTLFLAAGLLGGISGTLGMFVFHHKTNHWDFRAFFPSLMIIQIVIIIFRQISYPFHTFRTPPSYGTKL